MTSDSMNSSEVYLTQPEMSQLTTEKLSLVESLQDRRKTMPHLFPKGVSGNPNGRPAGSKNRITLLKHSLEEQLRQEASGVMVPVLQKCMEMALKGDRAMIKLLMELHISKPGTVESEDAGKSKITVNIRNLDLNKKESVNTLPPIEGEFTKVVENNVEAGNETSSLDPTV